MISPETLTSMTNDELKDLNHQVVALLNARQRQFQASLAVTFSPGDKVVINSKRGPVMGIVEKVNQKTVIVRDASGGFTNALYKCSPSLLRRA